MTEGTELEEDGFVPFYATGETVTGDYSCSVCGYGVSVQRVLPPCPMCGGTAWERSPWRPFTRVN